MNVSSLEDRRCGITDVLHYLSYVFNDVTGCVRVNCKKDENYQMPNIVNVRFGIDIFLTYDMFVVTA